MALVGLAVDIGGITLTIIVSNSSSCSSGTCIDADPDPQAQFELHCYLVPDNNASDCEISPRILAVPKNRGPQEYNPLLLFDSRVREKPLHSISSLK